MVPSPPFCKGCCFAALLNVPLSCISPLCLPKKQKGQIGFKAFLPGIEKCYKTHALTQWEWVACVPHSPAEMPSSKRNSLSRATTAWLSLSPSHQSLWHACEIAHCLVCFVACLDHYGGLSSPSRCRPFREGELAIIVISFTELKLVISSSPERRASLFSPRTLSPFPLNPN